MGFPEASVARFGDYELAPPYKKNGENLRFSFYLILISALHSITESSFIISPIESAIT